jgi:hypothetical protein
MITELNPTPVKYHVYYKEITFIISRINIDKWILKFYCNKHREEYLITNKFDLYIWEDDPGIYDCIFKTYEDALQHLSLYLINKHI